MGKINPNLHTAATIINNKAQTNVAARRTSMKEDIKRVTPAPERKPYTLLHLKNVATTFFTNTTGASPSIASHYATLTPEYLNREMTPENVNDFVDRENAAITKQVKSNLKGSTNVDLIAFIATPVRKTGAHFAAQNAVIGQSGFLSDNEYADSARQGIIAPDWN
ncbi:hypothetical protein [Vibrio sagamiensis]|uniref:Uncharacterized protein n=1 Tax=Vibrio sagamiensis NBRC 104589 TaxID=1219064 RepID=A0A511QJD9_9VIBR|nr:hypothetical protein [Vibrio sagamiensis]PNQ53790.1 hypothetical protein C1141_19345 [Vibrio agarivorans]GEM77440.1 hypothetical protein VSA01S_35520 [Vibrio sagamiensis NBRC 104589]